MRGRRRLPVLLRLGSWLRVTPPVLQAGGIVVRRTREGMRVLVVSARRRRNRWVLPKGTVQAGETPAAAAVREVREEAGITGRARGRGSVVEYNTRGGRVRVEYFLIEFRREVSEGEGRRVRWCAVEDAIALLTYASARRVLLESNDKIRRLMRPSTRAKKRAPRSGRK